MSHVTSAHKMRKEKIITTAKDLFFQKGYNNTTVQDIIDSRGIAKGTFYHYFKSKDELLDALVDHIMTDMSERLKPLTTAQKGAIEKINDVFRIGAAYKAENLEAFIVILKTLYRDENRILRDRMFQCSIEKNGPIIAQIVQQGIDEGVFTTSFPKHMGEIMINLGRGINEVVCNTLLAKGTNVQTSTAFMIEKLKMYQEIIERVLGAPEGSIAVYEPEEFQRIVGRFFKRLHSEQDITVTEKRYMML